ncbi:MAG: nucleotidyltransferase family protein [Candidatus Marinimicrobia bacterium]|jgi:molybdenum cofactor cytidylyltransferase|nr:nucleotidyltransferase family protein [Candidatus Neomarinimicrobiota bacterium]MBT4063996.1 nucleotidyltransferase family protein [Candidatus Neomarinimicrobiota bacterium]MBT4736146.1 nucleotidyltransferase family protein [Candidatus Neomarinimicrobiota bacterium]MBT5385869.1 nucleotidyltransferase family protein [Candidatus Neomarinimicrobiota bacterium]MCP4931220.1 nucleotidyltransferase family protein [Candidatus Neomarinimicrobiota bacterium]|tara:strand:- start:3579 stop:4166 length:588 start_codon:yes stop_codon:yes gene_type:complete
MMKKNIAGIVLAAGGSTRMGQKNKLILHVNGMSIISSTVGAAVESSLDPVRVVLGNDSNTVKRELINYPVSFIHNNNWMEGMATSIVSGMENLDSDGIMFILGDMPFISSKIINQLVQQFDSNKIIVPFNNGKRGNPVIFPSHLFSELKKISGDRGAKPLIQKYNEDVKEVPIQSKAIFQDIDDREELMNVNDQI